MAKDCDPCDDITVLCDYWEQWLYHSAVNNHKKE